ncbi:hypothetical protein MHT86_07560 [Corynebacterium mastitidis]|uniref:hypothetical protein n=1 Tax=Corynebacterium mastitidis TaxID=161890 RepID=UPI0012FEF89F|nr:hypothetical protein [Corynebacterium mastitidis]MCH6197348.1 hypothetical protein [Corynebacterium mastitidis]
MRRGVETIRDGCVIACCLAGLALLGALAGAANNVYVAHRHAQTMDAAVAGPELAAKVERAWEFMQAAGCCAVLLAALVAGVIALNRIVARG